MGFFVSENVPVPFFFGGDQSFGLHPSAAGTSRQGKESSTSSSIMLRLAGVGYDVPVSPHSRRLSPVEHPKMKPATLGCAAILASLLASPSAPAQRLAAEEITRDVTMPTWAGTAPGDGDRIFITERNSGLVRIVRDGQVLPTPFLDVSPNMRPRFDGGLMCMAFDPDFADNGSFYVYYTDRRNDGVVERFEVSSDPDVADPATRFEVIRIERTGPEDMHAGGFIGFSPTDGYLYITSGDGGPQGDPNGNAQNGLLPLGKILRIDVQGDIGYSIPPDNPFIGNSEFLPEIWALGLRNPWRAAFDSRTGDLYVADVGHESWEELTFIADGDGGRNLGWAIEEGSQCFPPDRACDPRGLTDPIVEYAHGVEPPRCCIIGGAVYRGSAMPLLDGHSFYSDFCSGEIWSLLYDGQRIVETLDHSAQIRRPDGQRFGGLSSITQDHEGNLLIVDFTSGVYRVVTVMQLDVPPLIGGQRAEFTMAGATPSARVALLYTTRGTGRTRIEQLGVTVALNRPHLAGWATADEQGAVRWSVPISLAAEGRTIWFQAAEMGNASDVFSRVVE